MSRDENAEAIAKRDFLLANCVEEAGPLETPCLIWQLGSDTFGYGEIYYRGHQYRTHRLAYILDHGPISKGLHVSILATGLHAATRCTFVLGRIRTMRMIR
jgi:hypothetical protein